MVAHTTTACRHRLDTPASIHLPQIGGQDVQLRPVLRHRAARDHDPFFLEHLHDLLVRQRLARVLALEHLRHHVLDARVGHPAPAGRLNPRREKELHLKNPLGRVHVFV